MMIGDVYDDDCSLRVLQRSSSSSSSSSGSNVHRLCFKPGGCLTPLGMGRHGGCQDRVFGRAGLRALIS